MGRLDVSDPEVKAAIADVKEHNSPTNFVVFKYVPKTDKIKVQTSSDGDLSAMLDELNEGQVQYVFIRFKVSEGYKFVYIAWCGEGVSGMLRGNLANHATDFENFLTQNQLAFHVRINARSENDLKEADIISKINKAKGADFVKAGTRAQGTGPDLKQVSGQFWNQQTAIDKDHAAQVEQHKKSKLSEMEQSRQQEESRIKAEADRLLGEKEREREAENAAHQKAEAQRANAWNKHQQAQLNKVQKEQEQMRAAAPKSDIGAASTNRADAPAHNKFNAPEPEPSRATQKPAFGAPGGAAPGRLNVKPPQASAPPPAAAPPPSAPKPKAAAPPPVRQPEPEPEPEPEPVVEAAPPADDGYGGGGAPADDGWGGGGGAAPADDGYGAPADAAPADDGFGGGAADAPAAGNVLFVAVALYDFAGENAGDLPFAEGDRINVLNNDDAEGWWQGELNGQTGWFASNFVQREG